MEKTIIFLLTIFIIIFPGSGLLEVNNSKLNESNSGSLTTPIGVEIITDPPLPMLWRDVIFNAEIPGKKNLNFSRWDFGNGSVNLNKSATFKFNEPGKYTVSFNGTDKKGNVYKGSKSLDFTILPGDILFSYNPDDRLNPGQFNLIALVIDNTSIITLEEGIVDYSISEFLEPPSYRIAWGRVKNISHTEIQNVIRFAKEKENEQPPFDYTSINPLHLAKQENGSTWYCSELVWASYWNGTNGRIDLDSDTIKIPQKYASLLKGDAVLADEILNSPHLEILGLYKKG